LLGPVGDRLESSNEHCGCRRPIPCSSR
jgi:hypothetical protein